MSTSDFRLPSTIVPRSYDLTLEPDLANASFVGRVSIEIEVTESVDEIVLHAAELEISNVVLEPVDLAGVAAVGAAVHIDDDSESATLMADSTIAPGLWELTCTFTGSLNDKLVGFYRSTFVDDEGETQTIATTQFQAPHARRAFPCFDEPDFKATFTVTLVVAEGLLAVSNTGETGRETMEDGRVAVSFAETIPMSTYLVAFVVGPLEVTEPVDVDGIPVRIVHAPGKGHLTSFSIETAAAALRYFTDYFDMPYPSDKLDMIAVPDFAFGAMENLGCVTFREVLLLVDPDTATQPELQRVADVINHELAHMWFGDLVTMRWWNGIWLNEAFATFMEMRATDDQHPEWLRWVDFGLSRTAAFDVDALDTTRPIEFEVRSPADAEGMFDLLTYEKGAAVVRMLEQFITEDPFRDGIRRYMVDHRLSNTETTDLWDAIEASTDVAAREIMDSWIYQPGFPLVTAERNGATLELSQTRFSYAEADVSSTGGASDQAALWQIPLRYRVGVAGGEEVDGRVLMTGATASVKLPPGAEWVVVNAEGSSFVRSFYGSSLMPAVAAVAVDNLGPVERYGLVDDLWAAVVAGHAEAGAFVELAEELANSGESDLSVWQRIVGALDTIHRIADPGTTPALARRIDALLRPAHDALATQAAASASGLDDRARQLRATLFGALARISGDAEMVDAARTMHESYQADPNSVDPGMMSAALRVLAAHGTEADFEALLEGFRDSATPQEELRHLNAMADVADSDLMTRVLDLTLDEVRTQNAPYVIGQALTNGHQHAAAWSFIVDNWDTMGEKFPSNSLPRMLGGIRTFTDQALATEVRGFFESNQIGAGTRTLEQHLERMDINVALAERERGRLAASLSST